MNAPTITTRLFPAPSPREARHASEVALLLRAQRQDIGRPVRQSRVGNACRVVVDARGTAVMVAWPVANHEAHPCGTVELVLDVSHDPQSGVATARLLIHRRHRTHVDVLEVESVDDVIGRQAMPPRDPQALVGFTALMANKVACADDPSVVALMEAAVSVAVPSVFGVVI